LYTIRNELHIERGDTFIDIKQQIKEILLKEKITMTDLVNLLNKNKTGENNRTTVSSLNNKLTRGTIKYSEILEIFDVLDYDITLQKRIKANEQLTILENYKPFSIPKPQVESLFAGSGKINKSVLFKNNFNIKYGTVTGGKNKNIITSNDVIKNAKEFENKNGYNPIMSDDKIYEMELQQERINLEDDFEENINDLLDRIIDNYNPMIKKHYKELIETYHGAKSFPLSFKLTTLYRVIYRLLSVQSDSSLRDFITRLRNIYAEGDLVKLTDEELNKLYDTSVYYIESLNNKND
jgi:hypothetical protein